MHHCTSIKLQLYIIAHLNLQKEKTFFQTLLLFSRSSQSHLTTITIYLHLFHVLHCEITVYINNRVCILTF